MRDQILDLSKKLIEVNSNSKNIEGLTKVIQIAKSELYNFKYKEFQSNSVPSILFYNQSELPERFKIILNAHLDVVPGEEYQYKPFEKDGKLFGRGTNDMKAAGAVEILIYKNIAKSLNYPIGLQLVTDEEIGGHDGAKHQCEQGILSDFVIAGEPTKFDLKNETKGNFWLNIKSKGLSAHGAYPWKGENAIWKIKEFLDRLEKEFPEAKTDDWVTTVNLSGINSTNLTINKVPEDCSVSLDIRYVPSESKIIENKIRKLVPEGLELEIMNKEDGQFTPTENDYIRQLQQSTKEIVSEGGNIIRSPGGSDIRHFTAFGCGGVEFGPTGDGHHSPEEWVDVQSLVDYYKILDAFLMKLS